MNEISIDKKIKVDLLNDAALKLQEAGEYQRAIELLHDSIEALPEHAPSYVSIGLAYQNLGKVELAESNFRQSVEIDPYYEQGLQSLGLFLISQGRKQEGVEWLQKYLDENQWQDAEHTQLFVSTLQDLDRSEEASIVLSEAWERTKNPEIGLILADFLKELGKIHEAVRLYELLAYKVDDYKIFNKLGRSLIIIGQYEEAMKAFARAIEKLEHIWNYEIDEFSDNLLIDETPLEELISLNYYFLAKCYLELGRYQDAIDSLSFSQNYGWNDEFDNLIKVKALMGLEKFEEAISICKKVIEGIDTIDEDDSPFLGEFYEILSDALIKLQRPDQALDILQDGISKFPNYYVIYLQAIILLTRLRDIESAIDLFDKALNSRISLRIKPSLLLMKGRLLEDHDRFYGFLSSSIDLIKSLETNDMSTFASGLISDLLPKEVLLSNVTYNKLLDELFLLIPQNFDLKRAIAWIKLAQGDIHKAKEIYEQLLSEDLHQFYRWEFLNNLACVYLHDGNFKLANKTLNEVLETYLPEVPGYEEQWLWTVIYRDNQFEATTLSYLFPENDIEKRYPDIRPSLAAQVNLIASNLAKGNLDNAGSLAREVLSEKPGGSLAYEVLGSVAYAHKEINYAKDMWLIAKQYSKGPFKEKIYRWLDKLNQLLLEDE
jgi:tetratricopeptide (TPR) repeat protein